MTDNEQTTLEPCPKCGDTRALYGDHGNPTDEIACGACSWRAERSDWNTRVSAASTAGLREQVVDEWHRACHVNANIGPRDGFDFERLAKLLFAVMQALPQAASTAPVVDEQAINKAAQAIMDCFLMVEIDELPRSSDIRSILSQHFAAAASPAVPLRAEIVRRIALARSEKANAEKSGYDRDALRLDGAVGVLENLLEDIDIAAAAPQEDAPPSHRKDCGMPDTSQQLF